MSSSIESKLIGLESKLAGTGLPTEPRTINDQKRPTILTPTIPRRPPPMSLPIAVAKKPVDSEFDVKLKKINERNGLLHINGLDYITSQNDLEDMGELGSGTSGHVVKMKHKETGEVIAVKQMRRTGNDEENKRIIMDLDVVLKSSTCKYIVKCLGCFITDADVWICMELMTTCFDKLQKRTKTPVPENILGKVTVATVRALKYLKEEHGVIHRDVKPSNILIDNQGNIKLCDFGISGRLVDSKAKTRSAGCAAYMAPERIDPKKPSYDIRADVWSLGITLIELATGIFPYSGCKTDFEVLTKVLESNPPRLPPDFSNDFQDFVEKCLQKDYRHRPKYTELLNLSFLRKAENEDVSVGEWFRNVATRCGLLAARPAETGNTELNDQRFSQLPQTQQPQRHNSFTSSTMTSSIPVNINDTLPKNYQNFNYEYHQQQQSPSNQTQYHPPHNNHPTKINNINLATFEAELAQLHPQSQHPHYLKLSKPTHQNQPPTNGNYSKMSDNTRSDFGPTDYPIGEMNRMYKQSPFAVRRTAESTTDYGISPKKEGVLANFGQNFLKNLSPFASRKADNKASKPPLPDDVTSSSSGVNGIHARQAQLYHNNGSLDASNPSSPLLLNRKTFDIAEESQYKHLQGNTSPIVLQRFYHQQNQLLEKKIEQQKINEGVSSSSYYSYHPHPVQSAYSPHHAAEQSHSHIPIKYSPLPSHRPISSSINSYPPPPPSHPQTDSHLYQYQTLNSGSHHNNQYISNYNRLNNQFVDHGGGGGSHNYRESIEMELKNEADLRNYVYGTSEDFANYSSQQQQQQQHSNGDNIKDDNTGWFNSFAGVIKRRYASLVKVKLSNNGGNSSSSSNVDSKDNKNSKLDRSRESATVGPLSSYNSPNPYPFAQSSIPSAIQPVEGNKYFGVMSGIDRRHRSPDPPPRYNRGQSPLLLRRKLEIAQGSPILQHRRYISESPPLPPRRSSDSMPATPQHIRTKINYTPEPQRRPYHQYQVHNSNGKETE